MNYPNNKNERERKKMKKLFVIVICVMLVALIGVTMIDRINRTIIVKTSSTMENGYVVYSFDCNGLTKIHQTTKVVDNVHGDIQYFDHELNLVEFVKRVSWLSYIKAV